MDEKQNALNQIKAIHEVLYSGKQLIGSPRGLIVTGFICFLIAVLQLVSKLNERGGIGSKTAGILTIAIVVSGLALALNLGSRSAVREQEEIDRRNSTLHPLLKHCFGIAKVLMLGGIGLTIVWWAHIDRLLAIWMVLLGVIANLWARLIHKNVERFSYVLILAGASMGGLEEIGLSQDSMMTVALFFTGGWSLIAGLLLKKYQRR